MLTPALEPAMIGERKRGCHLKGTHYMMTEVKMIRVATIRDVKVYALDSDQLDILNYVKSKLYGDGSKLTSDARRDLANTLDAVLRNIEQYGDITDLLMKMDKDG